MCFVLLITGVGSLIHIYSVGYMAEDSERRRFFGYLNLFLAAMLLLVLADNYLGLYVGWEGVGLASYLLIGFWYHKPSAATAAKKAFVVNRVGDVGLAIAHVRDVRDVRLDLVHRCIRRVAGREPGRAHRDRTAAVAGGVRQVRTGAAAVLARRRDGGPDSGVGADPRRHHGHRRRVPDRAVKPDLQPRARRARPVWSSSARSRCCSARSSAAPRTTSRRRWPRRRCARSATWCWPPGSGPAGYAFAIMHLLTHGFFKAGLFLGAGSVMHAMNDEVNMRRYGGLRTVLPITFVTFGLGYLAIIGVPPLAGFFSKDRDHRDRARRRRRQGLHPRRRGAPGRRHHRVLHDPGDADDVLRRKALGPRPASARVAAGDDLADDRAGRRLGVSRRPARLRRHAAALAGAGGRRPRGDGERDPGVGDHRRCEFARSPQSLGGGRHGHRRRLPDVWHPVRCRPKRPPGRP